MSAQPADVRSGVAALRRRTRVLAAAAAVGLVTSVAYVMVEPPPLTSTALVLLPTPALADSSSSDVATQVRIALSATVMEQAGQAATPPLPPREVEKMVDVSAPTNQLLQIEATSSNAEEAQVLAQAVADAYVGYVSNTAREVSAAALADLKHRKDDLQAQIAQLQDEITAAATRQSAVDPNSAEGREEAQLLAGLKTQQANLSLQLDRVEEKIAAGTPVGTPAGGGTSVIQPATPATGQSTPVRLLVWAPAGALVCAIIAAIVLLVTARRDQRLRLRDDFADAIGSPVLAAVRSQPQRSVAGWSTLLATFEATPVESWAFRQVLRGLVPPERRGESRSPGRVDHPPSLTVVSLAGDTRGLAIGPQLAAFASSMGIPTQLVATGGDERAAALWAACTGKHVRPARRGLFLGEAQDREPTDLTVIMVVVDPTMPKIENSPSTAATILAVATGAATEQELARVAIAVDDVGRRIDGILVADPDQSDRTTGRRTMDERAQQTALPIRLTGIPSSDRTAAGRRRSRS